MSVRMTSGFCFEPTFINLVLVEYNDAVRVFSLRECRRANLPPEFGIACYESKIRPVLEYAAPIWGGLPQYLTDEIESIQNRCIKILGTSRCNFETLEQRRAHLTVKEYQRILSDPTNPCNKLIP
ncbi:Hypothetical predicted protein [Paramuricea clavata]|uniref:Uncharacterized protein n=1 Tax=Paramuricea clavata TaxID=317549 RepID=A0A6S7HSE0_PARCT|nr:Hypothetical predicted protein [Paramuricea clavata]